MARESGDRKLMAVGKMWTEIHDGNKVRYSLLVWQKDGIRMTTGTSGATISELRRAMDV